MNRVLLVLLLSVCLLAPGIGSANPNGVGAGEFDAQCGGACHGDADMNRSSSAIITLSAPNEIYEGLLTSITVQIESVETTESGMLGVFLLSGLSGSQDTPADAGWDIVSNSEGNAFNYLEIMVPNGRPTVEVTWTLKAPPVGEYSLYGAVHHGTEDGSEAPFYGVSPNPLNVNVLQVPEDLPRLSASFEPQIQRDIGEPTTMVLTTEFVTNMSIEWRTSSDNTVTIQATKDSEGTWSFELPTSIQPGMIEWRAVMSGEGPEQTTPWFQLRSDEPAWEVDNMLVYMQSFAMLFALMAGFMALQKTLSGPEKKVDYGELMIPPGGEY